MPHLDHPGQFMRLGDESIVGATATGDLTAIVDAETPLGVPILNSNPGARAQLYLDFDGDVATSWGGYAVTETPAYDTDGNPSAFSATELANIQQIFARVAEKYSPFNINVTTVQPASLADKVALRVVIGGNGAWTGGSYGGVAYVGSFTNYSPNTVYVFEDNLANGNPKYTAEASAHEAGHGFGLQHQSFYDASGVKTQEYYSGTSATAPIMGNSYYATRGLWWRGTSTSASTIQDDMAVLSNSTNAFGYRPDDFGGTTASAFKLEGASVSVAGIVEKMTDKDFFSFTTGGGAVSFTGSVATYGATLDLALELYNAQGQRIGLADTASFGETLSASLAAGTYYIAVGSHRGYGDVGQYTLTGAIAGAVESVAAPTSLSATVVSATQINLAWADQSTNETGFTLQRSTDGGTTWATLAVVGANTTAYTDASAQPGVTYSYRACADGSAADSAFSNTANATTVPLAPTAVTATALSASAIAVNWTNVAGETGYRVERSADGIAWSVLGTTGADVTTWTDSGLAAGTQWSYRVIALGLAGESAASPVASATTLAAPSVPDAPSGVTAVQIAKNKITVTWIDNSSNESGFMVERSTDGRSWKKMATLGAGATTWTDSTVRRGTYYYRVTAFNAAGSSLPSEVAAATMVSAKSQPLFSTTLIGSHQIKGRHARLFR